MKSVTQCLDAEELFYIRNKKPFQRLVVAGKSVNDFEHYFLYFINLTLTLSGDFFSVI